MTTRSAEPSTVVAVPIDTKPDVVRFAYSHGVYELPSCSDPLDVVAGTGLATGCTAGRTTVEGFGNGLPINQPPSDNATARATRRSQLAGMPPNVPSVEVASAGDRGRGAHFTRTIPGGAPGAARQPRIQCT